MRQADKSLDVRPPTRVRVTKSNCPHTGHHSTGSGLFGKGPFEEEDFERKSETIRNDPKTIRNDPKMIQNAKKRCEMVRNYAQMVQNSPKWTQNNQLTNFFGPNFERAFTPRT